MTNRKKVLLSLLAFFISFVMSFFIILEVSSIPSGSYSDSGFIEVGIMLTIATIIACTTLIILTIKHNSNS